jgi:hypothetical protein
MQTREVDLYQDVRTFNEEARRDLAYLMSSLVESRQSDAMARIGLERAKDEVVVAAFKADGCLYPRIHQPVG